MAVRQITTEISIKNEAEFRKQMKAVNNSISGMKSEMAKVSAEFDGQANSAEALRKKQAILQQQYDQQKEKVQALARMLESAKSAYDENSDVVLSYQRQLNTATVELIKFDRELKNTDKYLDEAAQSADGTASSIDEFGKTVKDAGDEGSKGMGQLKEAFGQLGEAAKSGDINGVVTALGSMKVVLVGGAAVAGAKALADGIINITESTKEYRTILGTLETSSKQAGYTQEQTTEIYKKFQAVLGDTQKAATATANLQALKLSQEDLTVLMEQAIGAWATYGDSIPIDSLSESINETVQVGKVTGVFADALNWAGTSEDEFNERLAACADTTERANLVLQQLSEQGLQATGQAWVENNQDIIAANTAQEAMNESMAQLGEALQPASSFLLEYGAALVDVAADGVNALSSLVEWFDNLFNAQQKATQASFEAIDSQYNLADYQANGLVNAGGVIDYAAAKRMQDAGTFKRAAGVSKSDALQRGWSVSSVSDLLKRRVNGSHADGLDYVPFDGYVAELHQGEAVLTSGEASFLRSAMAAGRTLGGSQRSSRAVSDSDTGGSGGTPKVYDLTIPVELTIDGVTFARKEYKYRIAEDNRRGVSLAGRGGSR
nr:MAG TPA_asm: minor tail protein [Caudoviricetes sp.]